jgi:biotin carboxyl carrier protein
MKFVVQVANQNFEIEIKKVGNNFSVSVGGNEHNVDLVKDPSGILHSFIIDGKQYEALCTDQGDITTVEFDEKCYDVAVGRAEGVRGSPIKHRAVSGHQTINAPMPGLVKVIKVAAGDSVKAGDPLLILEAMKMQNELRSPVAARVKDIFATAGKAVEKGEKLIALEVE